MLPGSGHDGVLDPSSKPNREYTREEPQVVSADKMRQLLLEMRLSPEFVERADSSLLAATATRALAVTQGFHSGERAESGLDPSQMTRCCCASAQADRQSNAGSMQSCL